MEMVNQKLAETSYANQRCQLSPQELVTQFESLGDNCELGAIQRHYGAEPLGAFRFSNPTAEKILYGPETKLAELGKELRVELDSQVPKREWILVDPIYNLRQHSFILEGDARGATIQEDMRRYFDFLRRKLLEDITSANKIFVIKAVPDVPPALAKRIAAALRAMGPAWLLWVVNEPNGPHVEVVEDRLLRGRVNGILPEGHANWGKFAFDQWLEVMRQAWERTHV